MSDTTTPADAGSDFGEAVKTLGIEGLAPTSEETSDNTPAEYDPADTPEGIPPSDRLKINGKEVEHTYAEIKKMAQMYGATTQRLEQAKTEIAKAKEMQGEVATQQQAVRNLLTVLKNGDLETIGNFAEQYLGVGDTFREAVIKYALQLYDYHKATPEQKEAMDNKKLVARLKQEQEDRQRTDQQRAWEYQVNQWSQHIATELPKAIQQVGLPDTSFVREHVITVWRSAIEQGKNPTAAAVANYVKTQFEQANINLTTGQPQARPNRPKATRESVGMKGNGKDEAPYMSWSEWQKTRKQ